MKEREKADGFFWSERYGARYCVVILCRTRYEWRWHHYDGGRERVQRLYAREYRANTVEALAAKIRRGGWTPPRRLGHLCRAKIHG